MVKWIYPTVNKFPKSQRFVLVQRIENMSFGILESVIKLTHKDSKILRRNIVIEIHKLQILLRISKDLAFLDISKYEHASEILNELKQLIDTESKIKYGELQQFI